MRKGKDGWDLYWEIWLGERKFEDIHIHIHIDTDTGFLEMVMASRSNVGGGSGSGGSSGRTRVGRYELGRTLGEGTFAKVKFARNVETGENVAIKILDKEKVLKHKMIGQVLLFSLEHFLCVCLLAFLSSFPGSSF